MKENNSLPECCALRDLDFHVPLGFLDRQEKLCRSIKKEEEKCSRTDEKDVLFHGNVA